MWKSIPVVELIVGTPPRSFLHTRFRQAMRNRRGGYQEKLGLES